MAYCGIIEQQEQYIRSGNSLTLFKIFFSNLLVFFMRVLYDHKYRFSQSLYICTSNNAKCSCEFWKISNISRTYILPGEWGGTAAISVDWVEGVEEICPPCLVVRNKCNPLMMSMRLCAPKICFRKSTDYYAQRGMAEVVLYI